MAVVFGQIIAVEVAPAPSQTLPRPGPPARHGEKGAIPHQTLVELAPRRSARDWHGCCKPTRAAQSWCNAT